MKPRCPEVLQTKKRSSSCGLYCSLTNNLPSSYPGMMSGTPALLAKSIQYKSPSILILGLIQLANSFSAGFSFPFLT